jgi:hypothetical protein
MTDTTGSPAARKYAFMAGEVNKTHGVVFS